MAPPVVPPVVPPVAPPVVPPVVPPPAPPPLPGEPLLGIEVPPLGAPGTTAPDETPAESEAMSKRLLLASTAVTSPPPALVAGATGTLTATWVDATRVAYAAGGEAGATVLAVDAATGAELFRARPFEGSFVGGLSVAGGDVTGDGVADVVVGAGPGGGPVVVVLDGATGAEARRFFAYAPTFRGGVNVSVGDTDGDGRAEVVTAPASAGGPHVRVFDDAGGEKAGFFAYAATVGGGVNVAAGDTDGDGRAEVVTAPAAGFAAHVRVWRVGGGAAAEAGGFFAFDPAFTGGASVAVADVNGDGRGDVLATPAAGGGPLLNAFTPTGVPLFGRMVYDDAGYRGGLRLAAGDYGRDGVADVLITPATGGNGVLRLLSGPAFDAPTDFDLAAAFPGVFVG